MIRFLKIALGALIVMTPLTLILEKYNNGEVHSAFIHVLTLIIMPGYMTYVLVTGDIHGWKPGPIGVSGRMAVTIFGSTLFWTTLIYATTRKRYRK